MQILPLDVRTSHPFERQGVIMSLYVPDVLEHAMDFPAAAAAFATIVTAAAAAAAAAAACALVAVAAATASASTAVLLDIREKTENKAVAAPALRHDAAPVAQLPIKSSICASGFKKIILHAPDPIGA